MSNRTNGLGRIVSALALVLTAGAFMLVGATGASADTCCFPDGSCQDNAVQQTCIAAGGAFFSGVTCVFHPCPPIGACCEADGSCSISAEQGCENRGGVWQGAGTTCATSCQPELGACCFDDGSCQDLSEDDCAAAGGNFNPGITCDKHPCPANLGQCCFPDGSCQDLTAEDCRLAGGVFNDQVTCALHPCPQPQGACPRTVGFWSQQCLCSQGEGGRVKFSCSEVDAITACVDDKSSFFSWANDRSSFCSIVNPTGAMNQRKQAKRQFVALLANVCTGELDIPANNGATVSLPESTPVDCGGFDADNVGELIDEINDALADLEGEDLTQQWVKDAYGEIISCADALNNGVGIDTSDCGSDDGTHSGAGKHETSTWGNVKGIYR